MRGERFGATVPVPKVIVFSLCLKEPPWAKAVDTNCCVSLAPFFGASSSAFLLRSAKSLTVTVSEDPLLSTSLLVSFGMPFFLFKGITGLWALNLLYFMVVDKLFRFVYLSDIFRLFTVVFAYSNYSVPIEQESDAFHWRRRVTPWVVCLLLPGGSSAECVCNMLRRLSIGGFAWELPGDTVWCSGETTMLD